MRRSQDGFTIIEVLIVLAIAGLIMLLVFLALPQLQRNGHNSQRKNDVSAILEAISHYELNHSGDFPQCGQGSFPSCYGSNNLLEFSKLTFYTSASPTSQVAVQALPAGGLAGNHTNSNVDTVQVYNHQKCAAGGSSTFSGAGFRDVVALYAVETGTSGNTPQCTEL
jgi:prepilin-type N-terminal cleavage/methylation domain-containing protein